MKRLSGNAWRDKVGTHVQLSGLLADKYSHATIVDIYPLGRICYENGPDCAEIFIDEWRDIQGIKNRTGNHRNELQLAGRWSESIVIETQAFDRLKIYINGNEELEINIGLASETGGKIMSWPHIDFRTDMGAISKLQ